MEELIRREMEEAQLFVPGKNKNKKIGGRKQNRVYIWIHVHCLMFIITLSTK